MNYLFENLNPESFQQFCQALLNKEFPNIQAFNVGQKDGGRDATSYLYGNKQDEFIVFQVKFVRDPSTIIDPHKWLIDVLKEELPKINKLIPKGATYYYLLTNVKGTAPLENGAIDRVDALLKEYIPINSQCYWRDDLSRKLDGLIDLKWSYPQILHGQDVLNQIVFYQANDGKARRESVIKAYLADQYDIDNEVKFKQIELQNNLFDLFVDVPIRLKGIDVFGNAYITIDSLESEYKKHKIIIGYETLNNIVNKSNEVGYVGGAALLLNEFVQKNLQKVIVEGGPGQGKSTITQYVCQVHRIRLLSKKHEFSKIPEGMISTPVRLPFKIDLRDLATWVAKKNPYGSLITEKTFSDNWGKSLEQFLVVHVIFHSQIFDFTSSDLLAIFRDSHLLFVFDGFDEIADFKIREEIVTIIKKGHNRIAENSKSIQIIVTSRPAAITSMSGFSSDEFPHLELIDVNTKITEQYVEKWIFSRRMKERDAIAIRKIVSDKLDLPHMKDLAKTPMQLAILLSLLSTRGESLPNKRTALYDSYIDLFFNRESEKNIDIRDNRDLIINIHQYLAWILHSEAELNNSNGRIEIDKLKTTLRSYLENEGHKTDLADTLFTVVNERVCALVSRVQGVFEFEVQPLREYFCAKYLYKTSPYTPAGIKSTGTKPERFDALSHNYYWQNVIRFFAGCFDSGELPLLIYKLDELNNSDSYKSTNYPMIVASYLLSDFVFTQTPLLQRKVIKMLTDKIKETRLINQSRGLLHTEEILLSKDCGLEEIVDECLAHLATFPKYDYGIELLNAIKNNKYPLLELRIKWEQYKPKSNTTNLVKWVEYAFKMKILPTYSAIELEELLEENKTLRVDLMKFVIGCRNKDYIRRNKEKILNSFLRIESTTGQNEEEKELVFILSALIRPSFYLNLMVNTMFNEHATLKEILIGGLYRYSSIADYSPLISIPESTDLVADEIDDKIYQYIEKIQVVLDCNLLQLTSSLDPWNKIISTGQNIFGDCEAFNVLAIISAGIKSKNEKCSKFSDFNDHSVPICYRLRNARLKSGNVRWWRELLVNSVELDRPLGLAMLITWGTPRTLAELLNEIIRSLNLLSSSETEILIKYVRLVGTINKITIDSFHILEELLLNDATPDVMKYLLLLKVNVQDIHNPRSKILEKYNGSHEQVLRWKLTWLINKFLEGNFDDKLLSSIVELYRRVGVYDVARTSMNARSNYLIKIPLKTAEKIVSNSAEYPTIFVSIAENICRKDSYSKVKAVGKIAQKDKWFLNGR